MTLLGSLRRLDGARGAVLVEDVYDTDIDDLWEACTDPARLARWIATIPADAAQVGEFDGSFTSGFEGRCRIEVCDRPHRLVVTIWDRDTGSEQDGASTIEARLAACDGGTRLIIEERGVPVEQLAGYGAGWQVHAEDLAAHVAGRDRDANPARWTDMVARYRDVDIA